LTALENFEAAAQRLNQATHQALTSANLAPAQQLALNQATMQLERNWLNPAGIPGRPWFKHILYGARYTYAHLELPGLTEAVEAQNWPLANQQAEILRQALIKNTALLDHLTQALSDEISQSAK
jgi:N-acetylated-alpha-linked acidic dipeptidase